MEQQQTDLATLAEPRRILYRFLSAAFADPPTDQSLSVLRNDTFLRAISQLFERHAISTLFQQVWDAPASLTIQEDMRQTFMNLFKIPGPEYVAPYESVYRDTRDIDGQPVRGLLMGPSAVGVQRWYRLAAADISDAFNDLPDHIMLELNFLAHLCGKEEEFFANDDEERLLRAWEIERDFLRAHVVSWVPALRDRIYEKCRHAYFRAIADLAVECTRRDLATLESVVEPGRPKAACAREKVPGADSRHSGPQAALPVCE